MPGTVPDKQAPGHPDGVHNGIHRVSRAHSAATNSAGCHRCDVARPASPHLESSPMPLRATTARPTSARLIAGSLGALLCLGVVTAPTADAAPKPRVFANCTQLNGVYPHGVGKVGAHDKGTGKTFRPVTTFTRNTALYQANVKMDRDKDGVACEKR
jgi:hypothetical protein